MDEGGVGIFESPYSYQRSASLQYWSTVAEVRRYTIQVTPDDEGGCTVVVRAPVRRSRRVNGAVGLALSGGAGAIGGLVGLGLTGAVAGAKGLAALPVALALVSTGVLGAERLTRFGYVHTYRYAFRTLERTFLRLLEKTRRDVEREMERKRLPEA
jgi:hypothetical protein